MPIASQPHVPLLRKGCAVSPRPNGPDAENNLEGEIVGIGRAVSVPVTKSSDSLQGPPQDDLRPSSFGNRALVRLPTKLWRHARIGLMARKHIAELSSWNHAISKVFRSFATKDDEINSGSLILDPQNVRSAFAALGTPFDETNPELKKRIEEGNVDLQAFQDIAQKAQTWHLIAAVTREAKLHHSVAPMLPSRLEDVLKMDKSKIEEALSNPVFVSNAADRIYLELQKHRDSGKSKSPAVAKVAESHEDNEAVVNTPARTAVPCHMDKFLSQGGFLGRFGDEYMFQGGLEQELGLADPSVLRAILREHIYFEDSQTLFLTPNYGVVTCPILELARILGDNNQLQKPVPFRTSWQYLSDMATKNDISKPFICPGLAELKNLNEEFRLLEEAFAESVSKKEGKFPGEAGDYYIETLLDANVQCEDPDAAITLANSVNSSLEAIVSSISTLFSSEEERARSLGVVIPAVAHEKSVTATFSFPWRASAPEKEAVFHKVLQTMFNIPEKSLKIAFRTDRKYVYSDFTDSAELRKHLERLTPTELTELISKLPSQDPPGLRKKDSPHRTPSECVDIVVHSFEAETAGLKKHNSIRKQARRRLTLEALMEIPEVKDAQLRIEEAIVAFLYTGPMYQKWNYVLRQLPHDKNNFFGNKYTTSIHTLVSAVLKLSRTTVIPQSRKVFRGLDGIVLDEKWFRPDARNTRGGVELGFLSTTLHKDVALQYCGVSAKKGTVFEIEIGKVDCGARLDGLSQYPCEGELLFGPLANLEVVGDPFLETHGAEQVVIVQLRININMKALTIEEMIGKRKRFQIDMIENVIKEIRFEVDKLLESGIKLTADQVQAGVDDMHNMLQSTKEVEPSWFNRNENFRKSWNSALDLKNAINARWTFPKVLESPDLYFWNGLLELEETYTATAVTSVALAICRMEKLFHHSINERDRGKNETTPLMLACLDRTKLDSIEDQDKLKRKRKIRLLLAARADVHARDKNGETALVHAVLHSRSEIIGLLVEAKSDPNTRNERDYTLLHQAAMKSKVDTVKALIQAKAEIDSKDKDKRTPLHRAALKGKADIVRALIQARADVNAKDQNMDTPLDWASNEECKALLIQAGGTSNGNL